jgi:hypothetical protein
MATPKKTKKVAAPEKTVASGENCSCGPSREEVETRAYHLWEKTGRPHGRDEDYWLQAEKELRAEYASHYHQVICSSNGTEPAAAKKRRITKAAK